MGQKLPKVRTIVLMSDRRQSAAKDIKAVGEYEDLLASMSAEYDFPDLDENTQATTFYTTGTTGVPKGVYFSHRQIVLHTLAELAIFGFASQRGGRDRPDVYMPMTPMFHVHAWGLPWSVPPRD
jgi:acyl-CoA synthetase (AMP-forming)/AMP-acid ligase II